MLFQKQKRIAAPVCTYSSNVDGGFKQDASLVLRKKRKEKKKPVTSHASFSCHKDNWPLGGGVRYSTQCNNGRGAFLLTVHFLGKRRGGQGGKHTVKGRHLWNSKRERGVQMCNYTGGKACWGQPAQPVLLLVMIPYNNSLLYIFYDK